MQLVYIVTSAGRFKIGRSASTTDKRVRNLAAMNAAPLIVVEQWHFRDTRELEVNLQTASYPYHDHGEWFRRWRPAHWRTLRAIVWDHAEAEAEATEPPLFRPPPIEPLLPAVIFLGGGGAPAYLPGETPYRHSEPAKYVWHRYRWSQHVPCYVADCHHAAMFWSADTFEWNRPVLTIPADGRLCLVCAS